MGVFYFSNEFPNEEVESLLRRVYSCSKQKRYRVVADFLTDATQVIRGELGQLPEGLRKLVPSFETVVDLTDHPGLRKGRLSGSIDGALLCVVQLATLIGYCENSNLRLHQIRQQDTILAGLGIGLLVSSALALAPALEDLPRIGTELIRIAIRLGLHVSEVSQNLELVDYEEPLESWAYVVHGVAPSDAQQELDKIHSEERCPTAGRIFLSAVNATSCTISGPPSRLQALFRTRGFFRDRKFAALPVYGGLCHAGHVYTVEDAKTVVQASVPMLEVPVHCSLLSTSTGKPFSGAKGSELVLEVVAEILTKQIAWDNVVQEIVRKVSQTTPMPSHLYTYGISLPVMDLTKALSSIESEATVSTIDVLHWVDGAAGDEVDPRTGMQSKIAIVGISCRLPGDATNTDKFWDLLVNGVDAHQKIPADRFDVDTHHDITGKRMNTSQTAYGCFIDEPGLFDAPFFNMSPREAEQTDPMQRLALVTAYEALERSGYVGNRTAATKLDRIGTWYGQASDDYREVNTAQEIGTYFIPGGCRAFGPGRINYFFKFAGPSFSCDTACSSSLATIQAACTALWAGDVDTVVAGGVNVLTNSDAFAGLSNGHFLTKTSNACKTWDIDADGYCRADGVASIVMKRLDDAYADNDNILGVITAAATNHSANAVSITHPHAGHQADLYRQVMRRAGTDPLDVSYVELHGTGTQAGDSEEMESVTNVFAPSTRRRNAKQPLYIGAVKSNVGHSEAAAGVTALVKVLMMLQKNTIPPHVGIKTGFNPKLPQDLAKRNLHIAFEKTPWNSTSPKPRRAVVNNFSAAGGNTTLALEEAPDRTRVGTDSRPTHVVTISAKSKTSFKRNLERLVEHLVLHPDISLSDLAYTTTARRYHHNYRMTVSALDHLSLKTSLESCINKIEAHKPIPATGPPSVAFAFTGQGSAERSMSLELFHGCPSFRSQMMHLDAIVQRQGFPSFIPAVDGTYAKEHSHPPVITQLALTCIQISLAKYWETLGVKPDLVVGHSLGEYAALCVAGVLSASDAIFLVGSRAQMLQEKCHVGSHAMMAVKAPLAQIESNVGDLAYEIACTNGPRDTVLSGTVEQMNAVAVNLRAAGLKCILLDNAFAFHSSQVEPILDEFERLATSAVIFGPLKVPVISPLLGKVVFDDKTITAQYLRRATREPVGFQGALEKAQSMSMIDDDTIWVEAGPHPVCCGFVRSTIPSTKIAISMLHRLENNWTTTAQSLAALHSAGVQVNWNEYHRPFERSLRLLDLPTYGWNNKNYWIQYRGDWALTKGNDYYETYKTTASKRVVSDLRTSSVQSIVEESFASSSVKVVMESDLMDSEFLAAARGHSMNNCGVVTSSIHADIAFTLGNYIARKMKSQLTQTDMEIADLEVTKGLVANKNTSAAQLIQVCAWTDDIGSGVVDLEWRSVDNDGTRNDPFATAKIIYGNAQTWLDYWSPLQYLIDSRIDTLEGMAADGVANRLSHNMIYTLFANSLVDYAEKYRGMQSVVLYGFEAYAEIVLTKAQSGTWTIPPQFIDSVAHLAGFVMNVSDSSDVANTFCVTPGWRSMRLAKPLVAGGVYRSYVRMMPYPSDANAYQGDVYVLQGDEVIGMVGGIQFHRYPRILLNRFFSPPDTTQNPSQTPLKPVKATVSTAQANGNVKKVKQDATPPSSDDSGTTSPKSTLVADGPVSAGQVQSSSAPAPATTDVDSTSGKALTLIADETGLGVTELTNETSFADVGIDSLMSLVIAEKFRDALGITIGGSLFLEHPTIGSLKAWLDEYYG